MSSSEVIAIKNVLVVGAGVMGSGIALCCVLAPKIERVVLQDVDKNATEKAKASIAKKFNYFKKKNGKQTVTD